MEFKLKIYPDGTEEWRLNDELHREDGPTVEYSDSKFWYLNDLLTEEQLISKKMQIDYPELYHIMSS